jgi:phosphoserine phosphatase
MNSIPDAPPPYRTCLFDCDSTLSAIEGIDELAGPFRREVEELTRKAMAGELSLESVYASRLERIRPSRAALEALGALYVARLLPGARELLAALRFLGKRVCIVSGGLAPAVGALGRALDFASADVFAVGLEFGSDGSYAGFDRRSPFARSSGKREFVRELGRAPGAAPIALVGDGMSDLEAAGDGALARFVAYAGVVRRPEVLARARVAADGKDLACLLPLLASEREMRILSRSREHERLCERASAPS